jgi:RNA polymerase sigma-70 factor (ECF subfamily)
VAISDVSTQLIKRCQLGEPEAFEELCRQIIHELFNWVFSILRDPDDTDEVLQESLIRVFKHIGTLKEADKFPQWLIRIAINQCYTHRSRKSRTEHYSLSEEIMVKTESNLFHPREVANPRQVLMQKEVLGEINAAIAKLPPKQRTAIMLFEVKGHSIREIAALLRCSEGAVKFNIHQARKKLRRELQHHLGRIRRQQ